MNNFFSIHIALGYYNNTYFGGWLLTNWSSNLFFFLGWLQDYLALCKTLCKTLSFLFAKEAFFLSLVSYQNRNEWTPLLWTNISFSFSQHSRVFKRQQNIFPIFLPKIRKGVSTFGLLILKNGHLATYSTVRSNTHATSIGAEIYQGKQWMWSILHFK